MNDSSQDETQSRKGAIHRARFAPCTITLGAIHQYCPKSVGRMKQSSAGDPPARVTPAAVRLRILFP